MSKNRNEFGHQLDADALIERAATQIQNSHPDKQQVEAAASRVWQRLSGASAEAAAGAAEVEQIAGCEDFQALIPAHLAGALPQARKLLLEDHTRECLPCRRVLKAAREGSPAADPAAAGAVVSRRRSGRRCCAPR